MLQQIKLFYFVITLFLLIVVPKSNAKTSQVILIEGVSDKSLQTGRDQTDEDFSISSLLSTLRQTFEDVKEIIQNIIKTFTIHVSQVTDDIRELLNEMGSTMIIALEELSNKMLEAGELLLRDIIKNVYHQLYQMKDEFQMLAFMADDQFNRVVDHFNNTLMNQSENIDLWAANLKYNLRTVNNTRLYKEGCQVVDDFIQHSTDLLRDCCNIAVKPVLSLCQNVRDLVAEAFRVLADAIERMQKCLEDKNSYLEFMVPCINLVSDDVNALISHAAQLRQNLTTMLPVKIMFSKFCISVVSVQMEQRRTKVKETIDAKIEDIQNMVK